MISYFNSPSLNILLKNVIGYSSLWSFFCNKTATIVCSEAYENTKKYLSKSGLTSTSAYEIDLFISLKDFLASTVHFISWFFLNILVMFINILAKLGMNLLNKFTFPLNDYTSFSLLGSSTFKIELTLSRSILIPSLEIIWPKIFPSSREKFDFLGFNEMPYFRHLRNTFSRCLICSLLDL